jgi:hypothetical protein
MSIRTCTIALVALTMMACAKPRKVVVPQSKPTPAQSSAAAAPKSAEPAPPTAAAGLTNADLDRYMAAFPAIAKGLTALDPVFAKRYRGTAVSLSGMVSPETLLARGALVKEHGYPSWEAFSAIQDDVAATMGILMARTLKMMSLGKNHQRIKAIDEQLRAPDLKPEERARLEAAAAKLKERAKGMKDVSLKMGKVSDEKAALIGARHTEISEMYKQVQVAGKQARAAKKAAKAAAKEATKEPVAPRVKPSK